MDICFGDGVGLVTMAYVSACICLEQSTQGSKRALPLAASVLKNPKVQEAVMDKGLEVMNKLVDKQLKIIDEAQEKASNFLAKNVSASANLGD